ncbi:cortistatin [Dipodomys merriami]|uniref:cortistatin n=1 Tax=Dipodomys merriami TaxID=94247 RepID=UPI0038557249
MGDARAGRRWPCVCGLLLLLLWGTAATHPERGAAGQDGVGDTGNIAKRQEDPPLQQPPRREKTEKTRCKNFFWKTFSSCK